MNLLLDTHIVIWTLGGFDRLSETTVKLIESPNNQVFVSSVSLWEIVTKVQIGKLTIPGGFLDSIRSQGFEILDFSERHAIQILKLPLHHRDPFDRALLAQASHEKFKFVTVDSALEQYRDDVDLLMMK